MFMPLKIAICYYRVSTQRQGHSGLGLEAQQACVRQFAQLNGYTVLQEFTEIESGKRNDRPLIQEALKACKKNKATLLIAKLDRLSRNVAFVSALLESKVDFIDLDMPFADEFFIILKAAIAQLEAKEISKRTKAGLQAAKARGVELGRNGKYVLSVRNREAADRFAKEMKPKIEKLKASGVTTYRHISKELNRRRVATFQGEGHRWHIATVYHLMTRLRNMEQHQSQ
jgi:DNA invertase Pin-like site-specific DNA recombinase